MAPLHEIAHLGHAELLTPEPERSPWFCTDVLGLTETGRAGNSVYLRTWCATRWPASSSPRTGKPSRGPRPNGPRGRPGG